MASPSASSATCWEQMECSQPSRSAPGHAQHVAVAAVDHAGAGGEHALLAQRVAVVPGDAGVAAGAGHGAVQVGGHRHGFIVRGGAFVPPRAVAAAAEHREVRAVEHETALVVQPRVQVVDQVGSASTTTRSRGTRRGCARPRPAGRTARRARGGRAGRTRAPRAARACGRRWSGRRRDRLADLLGRGVAELADRREHLLALRRHAQPARAQPGGEVGAGCRLVRGGRPSRPS